MLNGLQIYIHKNGLNERDVMNKLNDAAVISDNCISAADVCTGDAQTAIAWLEREKGELAL